jgi:hypothetical protein
MFSLNKFKVHVNQIEIGKMVTSMSLYESIHGDIRGILHVIDNINFFDTFINKEMPGVEITYNYLGTSMVIPLIANGITDQVITKTGKNYNIVLISISTVNKTVSRICDTYSGTSNDILINMWKETQGTEIPLSLNTQAVTKGKYVVPNISAGTAISNVVQSAYDENKTGMFLYQRLAEGGATRFVSLHDMARSKYYNDDGKTCFQIQNSYVDKSIITNPVGTVGSCDNFQLVSYNENYIQKLAGGLWGKRITEFELDQTKKTELTAIEYTSIDAPSYKISKKLYDNGVSLFTPDSKTDNDAIQNTKYRVFNTTLMAESTVAVPNLSCGMVVDVNQGGGDISRTKSDGEYIIASINHRYNMNDGEMNYVQDIGLTRE